MHPVIRRFPQMSLNIAPQSKGKLWWPAVRLINGKLCIKYPFKLSSENSTFVGVNVPVAAANLGGVAPVASTSTLSVGLAVIVAVSAATVTGLIILTGMFVARRIRKRRRLKRANTDGNTNSGFATRYNNAGDSGWFGSARSFASTDTNSSESSGANAS